MSWDQYKSKTRFLIPSNLDVRYLTALLGWTLAYLTFPCH